MRLFIAFAAAILTPACIMAAWYLYGQFATFAPDDPHIWIRARGFSILCLVIAAAHVLVLGIPAYLLLRWRELVRWWSTIGCGFVLGATPIAVLTWPLQYAQPGSSASIDGVPIMVDGAPTMAGWLQYLGGASLLGALGAAGAAAFWLIWRVSPKNSFKPPSESLRASDAA